MSNPDLILDLRKVEYIPDKGTCLIYDFYDSETGEVVLKNGKVDLDLKWLYPCNMQPTYIGQWYKIHHSSDKPYIMLQHSIHNYHYDVPLDERVIQLVSVFATENFLLK